MAETDPGVFAEAKRWYLQQGSADWRPIEPVEVRWLNRKALVLLPGMATRDEAEGLRNAMVGLERESFPELPDGEYYWCDLVGLDAVDEDGQVMGKVTGLLSSPANDILEIAGSSGKILVPFIDPYIKEVSVSDGTVVTSWREDY